MLSKNAFNALLKTLEEPPEHVKFLFATTEPEKVPPTVLSRCLVFALHHLPAEDIRAALARIVEAEGLEAEPAALAELARAARGSMRDALTLLDQVLAFGGGLLKRDEVAAMLGVADRDRVFDLLDALAAGEGEAVLGHVTELGRGVAGADNILDALAEALALTARRQLVPNAPLPAGSPAERIDALAKSLSLEEVQLDYDIVLKGRADLRLAGDQQQGLEMVALRLLAFRPAEGGDETASAPPAARRRAVEPAPASSRRESSAGDPLVSSVRHHESPPAEESGSGESWEATVAALGLRGMARELAQNCMLVERSDTLVRLALDGNKTHLLTERLRGALEKALCTYYGHALKLKVETAESRPTASPAAKQAAESASRAAELRRKIESDPHVSALQEAFGAQMLPDTLRRDDGTN